MAEDKTEGPAGEGKGKGLKIALFAMAMLLVAGVAGGTAWYFAAGSNAVAATGNADDAAAKKTARKSGEARIFVPMDQFVVNLSDANLDRYAQVAVVLEVYDSPAETQLKASMPAVRNAILLLLSARSAAELLTLDGKEQLAIDIALAARAVLAHENPPRPASAAERDATQAGRSFDEVDTGPIAAVHFSQFIVQ